MSASDRLIDVSTRHSVFVQRYAGGQSRDAQRLLTRLRQQIADRLAREPTEFRRDRLQAVLIDIESLSVRTFNQLHTSVAANAETFISGEARFTADMVGDVTEPGVMFNVPSADQLIFSVRKAPMNVNLAGTGGRNLDDYLTEFGVKKTREIIRGINDGILLGDTTPEISRALSDLIGKQRNQVDALVRTIVNHASSATRGALYDANADILTGYEWVSTLDNRVTLTCAALDGKVFQKGGPMPPRHFSCRSSTIPVVNPKFTLAKLSGERSSVNGPVAGGTTYGGWLAKQPDTFQNAALGPARAELFRSGQLTIEQFTDPTGEVYTLAELEKMHSLSF